MGRQTVMMAIIPVSLMLLTLRRSGSARQRPYYRATARAGDGGGRYPSLRSGTNYRCPPASLAGRLARVARPSLRSRLAPPQTPPRPGGLMTTVHPAGGPCGRRRATETNDGDPGGIRGRPEAVGVPGAVLMRLRGEAGVLAHEGARGDIFGALIKRADEKISALFASLRKGRPKADPCELARIPATSSPLGPWARARRRESCRVPNRQRDPDPGEPARAASGPTATFPTSRSRQARLTTFGAMPSP